MSFGLEIPLLVSEDQTEFYMQNDFLEKQAFQRRENSIVEGVVAMSLHKITTVLFPLSVCMVLSYYLI